MYYGLLKEQNKNNLGLQDDIEKIVASKEVLTKIKQEENKNLNLDPALFLGVLKFKELQFSTNNVL